MVFKSDLAVHKLALVDIAVYVPINTDAVHDVQHHAAKVGLACDKAMQIILNEITIKSLLLETGI